MNSSFATPFRGHSPNPAFTNANANANANRSTFTFRLDDENAPPDPTMAADAIIPGGSIFNSRQNSVAPSVSTLATPRASTPVVTLRNSLVQPSTIVPVKAGGGKIKFRVDPNMLSTFDPKDKELYELWAARLP